MTTLLSSSDQKACRGPTWGVKFTSSFYPWVGWWEIQPWDLDSFTWTVRSDNLLLNLQNSRQRESKLGPQTADNGIRSDNTRLADSRFLSRTLNHKPYLFRFILESVSSVPTCQGRREDRIEYVIWDNTQTLATYILITWVSCIAGRFFTVWAKSEAHGLGVDMESRRPPADNRNIFIYYTVKI